jgi:hypothetical protein
MKDILVMTQSGQTIDFMFVHVPKAGGASIVEAIKAKYGADLHRDYRDKIVDPNSMYNTDFEGFLALDHAQNLIGKRAVAGHFSALKYSRIHVANRTCILRDPLERLLSNYFYWKGTKPNPANGFNVKFHAENLSVEEFASFDLIQNFYSNCIFRDVDMAQFDYIGDFADLVPHWDKVMARMDLPSERIQRNVTQDIYQGYREEKAAVLDDSQLMGRLRDALITDLKFYEKWTMPMGAA